MNNHSVFDSIPEPQVENRYNLTSTSQQYPPPQHGGRVPNINAPAAIAFAASQQSLYRADKPIEFQDAREDLIGHQHTKTPLNMVFFSQSNIDYIHSQIIEQVSRMSGGKYRIDRQGDDEVRIVMRSYYLMFARNDPTQVAQDLKELNARVIGYCSAKVYSEVDFHAFYLKDLEDFAPAIANPINPKHYGSEPGELKSFF
jgi:hypothetical protein